jgi:hypothetical protein
MLKPPPVTGQPSRRDFRRPGHMTGRLLRLCSRKRRFPVTSESVVAFHVRLIISVLAAPTHAPAVFYKPINGKIRDARGTENRFKVARYLQGWGGNAPMVRFAVFIRPDSAILEPAYPAPGMSSSSLTGYPRKLFSHPIVAHLIRA